MKEPLNPAIEAGVAHLKQADPTLALLINDAPTPSLLPHTNYYQELVESIISQQLSVKAAATILKRFRALFGDEFPEPAEILATPAETLREVGLSWQKTSYIQDLALKVMDGTIAFDNLNHLTNDEIIAELTKIKGVGVWTVHMFLMFCVGRLDVLPVGDLGIKNAIHINYGLSVKPTPDEITALAEKNNWHPYETIASLYLWHSLNNKPALKG